MFENMITKVYAENIFGSFENSHNFFLFLDKSIYHLKIVSCIFEIIYFIPGSQTLIFFLSIFVIFLRNTYFLILNVLVSKYTKWCHVEKKAALSLL